MKLRSTRWVLCILCLLPVVAAMALPVRQAAASVDSPGSPVYLAPKIGAGSTTNGRVVYYQMTGTWPGVGPESGWETYDCEVGWAEAYGQFGNRLWRYASLLRYETNGRQVRFVAISHQPKVDHPYWRYVRGGFTQSGSGTGEMDALSSGTFDGCAGCGGPLDANIYYTVKPTGCDWHSEIK